MPSNPVPNPAPAGDEMYVIRKRGLFYKPFASGYTSVLRDAGRYSEAEARRHESAADGVSIMRLSEAVELWTSPEEREIAALRADRDALRAALAEVCDDLEAEITARYPPDTHPYYDRVRNRDMDSVVRARALLPPTTQVPAPSGVDSDETETGVGQ